MIQLWWNLTRGPPCKLPQPLQLAPLDSQWLNSKAVQDGQALHPVMESKPINPVEEPNLLSLCSQSSSVVSTSFQHVCYKQL